MRVLLLLLIFYIVSCTGLKRSSDAKYDELLSRSKFFPLAAAAYSDNPEKCVENKFNNATVIKTYGVPCGSGANDQDTCFGFLAILREEQAIALGFRGSMSKEQIIREGVDTLFKPGVPAFGNAKISFYFSTAFNAVWNGGGMKADFSRAAEQFSNYSIWVTGHSLGGAMASICAAQIAFDLPKEAHRILLYTYGQPRVGNRNYADFVDRNIPVAYRVVHYRDVVANVPLIDMSRFWHHKMAVVYNQSMNIGSGYGECDGSDIQCTVKYFTVQNSVDDHVFYYGVRVSDYGINGCRLTQRVGIDLRPLEQ
ncbi:unnamed protein product [Bursaphelenchus xylophilus]|uniref:(pine wood nematode) hypothetical protein n=1 Tax=Bursaphelenchus xylophilus TaxID=6326 RepID=A0A1I7S1A1_BURXY|nr:unnamed protein product [Bursaphelenchus xylophilus]CAG9080176.1 unnamed protein product [Bursaphelenchus xylophilus]